MLLHISRRLLLLQLLLLALSACRSKPGYKGSLVIGIVSYDEGNQIISRYQRFSRYLSTALKAHVEIEPTFNETKSLERIQSQAWTLVFAPPGVAAIAISEHQYRPLFPQSSMGQIPRCFAAKHQGCNPNLDSGANLLPYPACSAAGFIDSVPILTSQR